MLRQTQHTAWLIEYLPCIPATEGIRNKKTSKAKSATAPRVKTLTCVTTNANKPTTKHIFEMMKTQFFTTLFFALTLLYSCNSEQKEQLGYGQSGELVTFLEEPPAIEKSKVRFSTPDIKANEEIPDEIPSDETLKTIPKKNVKKIIKDGSISVKTNDIQLSKKGIDDLLEKLNAYYESEDLQNNDQTIYYYLKIRVPADNFEKLISSIESGSDEIKSKSIQARDITEEYVDIETRLANKREYLKRYKDLLSKATSVKDILAIEENIRILQEEIESKEGRLKYLSDQVSFSTLEINLYKDKEFVYKPQPKDKFSERVKKSLSNGWTSVVDFVLWIITIWPFIILTFLAVFIMSRPKIG